MTPCPHCKNQPTTEKAAALFFVICKSNPCAQRRNGAMTIGRPLSNGKPTIQAAIEDYEAACRRRPA